MAGKYMLVNGEWVSTSPSFPTSEGKGITPGAPPAGRVGLAFNQLVSKFEDKLHDKAARDDSDLDKKVNKVVEDAAASIREGRSVFHGDISKAKSIKGETDSQGRDHFIAVP